MFSKRFQSLTGQESSGASVLSTDLTASFSDLEVVKQEILAEVRKEIHQAKQEIIDGIKFGFEIVTNDLIIIISLLE